MPGIVAWTPLSSEVLLIRPRFIREELAGRSCNHIIQCSCPVTYARGTNEPVLDPVAMALTLVLNPRDHACHDQLQDQFSEVEQVVEEGRVRILTGDLDSLQHPSYRNHLGPR